MDGTDWKMKVFLFGKTSGKCLFSGGYSIYKKEVNHPKTEMKVIFQSHQFAFGGIC